MHNMFQHKDHRGQDFLVGALIGGAVATLTTLLFTTKQGKRIQNKVIDTFENIEEDAKEMFSDAKDKVKEKASAVKEKAGEVKEKIEDGIEHAHKKVSDALHDTHHKSKKDS